LYHIIKVRGGDDACHQGEHSVRSEADDDAHQSHDQLLKGVDALYYPRAHLRLFAVQSQHGNPQQEREDDDANH
jgi:hypothetical protein